MDNHELRMGAGQAAMVTVDALDDETIAHVERIGEAIGALVEHLDELGLPPLAIFNWVTGATVGILYQWNEDRREEDRS